MNCGFQIKASKWWILNSKNKIRCQACSSSEHWKVIPPKGSGISTPMQKAMKNELWKSLIASQNTSKVNLKQGKLKFDKKFRKYYDFMEEYKQENPKAYAQAKRFLDRRISLGADEEK